MLVSWRSIFINFHFLRRPKWGDLFCAYVCVMLNLWLHHPAFRALRFSSRCRPFIQMWSAKATCLRVEPNVFLNRTLCFAKKQVGTLTNKPVMEIVTHLDEILNPWVAMKYIYMYVYIFVLFCFILFCFLCSDTGRLECAGVWWLSGVGRPSTMSTMSRFSGASGGELAMEWRSSAMPLVCCSESDRIGSWNLCCRILGISFAWNWKDTYGLIMNDLHFFLKMIFHSTDVKPYTSTIWNHVNDVYSSMSTAVGAMRLWPGSRHVVARTGLWWVLDIQIVGGLMWSNVIQPLRDSALRTNKDDVYEQFTCKLVLKMPPAQYELFFCSKFLNVSFLFISDVRPIGGAGFCPTWVFLFYFGLKWCHWWFLACDKT